MAKLDPEWPAAVWNFPAGRTGAVRLKMRLQPGFRGAHALLTDSFSVPFDLEAEINLVFGRAFLGLSQCERHRQRGWPARGDRSGTPRNGQLPQLPQDSRS